MQSPPLALPWTELVNAGRGCILCRLGKQTNDNRTRGGNIVTTHILIHGEKDTVGVAVVEDIEAGMELTGWVMETDDTISVEARDPIPLGHKVALQDIAEGDTVYKYGHDIGRAVQAIPRGHHVHVHNTKTKRW
jgi:(2R)-sulfolactate sulfo-lyase subunit alpha